MQNFGLNCIYFSKAVDCGLNSRESRDSYAKRTDRTIIYRSRPQDSELAGWIGSTYDLIWSVGFGSDGQSASRATAAAERHRSSAPRWRAAGGSPALAENGRPGLFWAAGWCKRTSSARVVHWGS